MVLSISLKALSKYKILLGILILVFPILACRAQVVHPEGAKVVGEMAITSADGVDVNPGSDVDVDLLTLGVTGTPRLWWDESADLFTLTHALLANTSIAVDNLLLDGNTLSATDASGPLTLSTTGSGDITLDATGSGDVVLNGSGSGGVIFNNLTLSTVPYIGVSKEIVSSAVTPTELGYSSGLTSALCGISDTCTLTNKSVNDSLNILGANELRFQDTTGGEYMGFKAPGTVTASTTLTLPDGDGSAGQALITDAAGTLSWGDAGGGGTGLNYIKNTDYEVGSADVTVTANITKALETVDPLRGTQSLKLTIGTGATTADYADLEMNDIDNFDQDGSMMLNVAFDYYTSANFTTDDVEFVLRRVDATAADIKFIGKDSPGKILASTKKIRFTGRVQVDSDANTYALRMNILSAPTLTSSVKVENVSVGPGVVVPGTIPGDAVRYTKVDAQSMPSAANTIVGFDVIDYDEKGLVSGTGTSWKYTAKITGYLDISAALLLTASSSWNDSEECRIAVTKNGATFAHGHREATMPTGVSNYASTMINTTMDVVPGDEIAFFLYQTSGASINVHTGTGFNYVTINEHVRSGASLSTFEQAISTVFTHTSVATPTGTVAASYNAAKFPTPDSDKFSAYNVSTGQWIAPRTGTVDVSGKLEISYTSAASKTSFIRIRNTTASKSLTGANFFPGTSNRGRPQISGQLDVTRGDIIEIQSWSDGASPSYVASESSFSIAYRPDYTSTSVFGESELIESSSGLVAYAPTASQWGDLDSVSLSPGTYDIYIQVGENNNGTVTAGLMCMGTSTTSGNSAPGTEGDDYICTNVLATNSERRNITLLKSGVVVTSAETHYLKTYYGAATTNVQVGWKISARRIQ